MPNSNCNNGISLWSRLNGAVASGDGKAQKHDADLLTTSDGLKPPTVAETGELIHYFKIKNVTCHTENREEAFIPLCYEGHDLELKAVDALPVLTDEGGDNWSYLLSLIVLTLAVFSLVDISIPLSYFENLKKRSSRVSCAFGRRSLRSWSTVRRIVLVVAQVLSAASTANPSPLPSTSPTSTSTPTAPVPLDLRESILSGQEPCFNYTAEEKLFRLTCNELEWLSHGYGPETHISLGPHEIFDGSAGQTGRQIIDLTGLINFEGLFKMMANVNSAEEAPLIKNVHVKGGNTAERAGFVIQKRQKYFTVDSCTSTGEITNTGAGGICGSWCGEYNGEISIVDSYTTGRISGWAAGGITGSSV